MHTYIHTCIHTTYIHLLEMYRMALDGENTVKGSLTLSLCEGNVWESDEHFAAAHN